MEQTRTMKPRMMSRSAWLAAALGCAVALVPLAARAWVYESPYEFVAEADLDGDGRTDIVIVDKATGAFRVGYQSVVGAPAWSAPRSTGIENVTSVSVAPVLTAGRDTVVVTGPTANRVNLVEAPNASSPALPVSVFIPSLGPSFVAAIDIGGGGNTSFPDLYVSSRENPGARETLIRNTGATRSLLSDSSAAFYRERGHVFVPRTGQPAVLGIFNRNNPAADNFTILDFSSGSISQLHISTPPVTNSPRSPEFLSARFNTNDVNAQLLVYQPGASNLVDFQICCTYGLGLFGNYNMGAPIQQVELLPTASAPRLLVTFGATPTNATIARVYNFDGSNAPVLVQSFTNASGFTGVGALGNGNFSMLIGDGSGRSARFQNIGANGSGYTNGASGALARINSYSGGANVLMFAGEPFVDPTAKALRSVRASDWTSSAVLGGGSPPTVSVQAESFVSVSNGLANPAATALGNAPAGTTFALINQYTNPISIFSRRAAMGDTAGDVTISPSAGEYTTAIKLTMAANTAGWVIQYRLTPNSSWLTYASPVTLFSNATVQFYARDAVNSAKTPIRSAAYTFTVSADRIDSDSDGVPDAIEVARGLDPTKGADSDGDGYTDLEELVRGTNPNDLTSVPTNFPTADLQQAFDLITTPRSVNATGTFSLCATGVAVSAYGLDGRLLSAGGTTNYPVPPAGVTNNAAPVALVQPIAGEALVAQATDQHFDLNVGGDTRVGREAVGIVRVPRLQLPALPAVDFSLGANAFNAWTSSVAAIITNLPRTTVVGDITYVDTLAAALLESKIAGVLLARGTNYATNLTLFSFRPADVARNAPTSADLANLETYSTASAAYRLTNAYAHLIGNLRTNTSTNVLELLSMAKTIYRLSAAHNNTNGALFKLPLDEIRYFLNHGAFESGYATYYSGGVNFAAASLGASNLLATVPPRPTTNVVIEVVTAGPGVTTTFRTVAGGTPVTLWQHDGTPCPLPASFDVLPGSQLTLFGFSDLPGAGLPVEVISVAVASVPVASDGDANGDLLIDTWQDVFFGGGFGNPFADSDGDGYSNLQEMLAGSDPNNAFNIPGVPVANFSAPVIGVTLAGVNGSVVFDWPAAYVGKFKFGVRSSATVDSGFTDLITTAPLNVGGNRFSMNFTAPPANQQFFVLTVALQP